MPTYVYRFLDTGETIEVQQSFADAALTEAAHPQTGVVMPVKKVFTPVGVTFKGGGFYKTDSRSSGRASSTSSSTSSDAGSSSTSSDSSSSGGESSSSSSPSKESKSSTASSTSSSSES